MNRMFKFPIVFLLLLVLLSVMPVGFSEISSVSVTPIESTVTQGQNATFSVTVTNDSKSTALGTTFSIEGQSVAGQFSPSELNLRKNQSGTVILTISTESLEAGSYPFRVKASAPAQKRQVASEAISNPITLEVTAPFEDTTAPVSNLEITSGTPGRDGWYTSDIGIKLTATDSDGSGVKEINYSLNDGPIVKVTGGSADITINTEGDNVLSYRAVDNAGNVEVSKSIDFKIDKRVPVVQGSGIKADGSSYSNGTTTDQDVTVSFEASDEYLVSLLVDGAEWFESGTTAKGTIVVTEEGTTTVFYVAMDLAGNTSSGVFTVVIENTIQQPTSIHYVALGDSIPAGVSYQKSTTLKIIESYTDKIYNTLVNQYDNVEYYDAAISGLNIYHEIEVSLFDQVMSHNDIRSYIASADLITLCIGANDIMDAAPAITTGRDFYNIDWAKADSGLDNIFEYWDDIINEIFILNSDVELVVMNMYNPYRISDLKTNATSHEVYGSETMHFLVDKYFYSVEDLNPSKNDGIDYGLNYIIENPDLVYENFSHQYKVVNAYDHFEIYDPTKSKLVAFYENYYLLWGFYPILIKDPHPTLLGQTVLYDLHAATMGW